MVESRAAPAPDRPWSWPQSPASRSASAMDGRMKGQTCRRTRSLSVAWRSSLLGRRRRCAGIAGGRSRGQVILSTYIVAYGPNAAIGPLIELLHFIPGERPRAETAEDRNLAARFVDATIAVEALGQRQRRARGIAPGDELRLGFGRKTVELGLTVRRSELQNFHSIGAVSDVREQRRVGLTDHHVARVGQLAVGGEFHDQLRQLRTLHVDA